MTGILKYGVRINSIGVALLCLLHPAHATVRFVAPDGGHSHPFTNWTMAATNIQAAVDAAVSGDTILVSNGIYETGARISPGGLSSNRLVIDKSVSVASMNGPAVTVIKGGGFLGNSAIRCVYVSTGAVVNGFTLSGGYTRDSSLSNSVNSSGAGAWCATNGAVENCVITSNRGYYSGGVFGGIVRSSFIYDNIAFQGGGASSSRVENCTIINNRAYQSGGGVFAGDVINSIVLWNKGPSGANGQGGNWRYSMSSPIPPGTGNVDQSPTLYAANNPHIFPGSIAVDGGDVSLMSGSTDIDRETRISGISADMGCDEIISPAFTEPATAFISATYTQAVAGFPLEFSVHADGRAHHTRWNFGDGTIVSNSPFVSHAWNTSGTYTMSWIAVNQGGATTSSILVNILAGYTNYVATNGNHVAPFLSWANAATSIQAAIDVAPAGGVIMVGEGRYANSAYVTEGMTNRIGIYKPVLVTASNPAPYATIIAGQGPMGLNAMRCAYLTAGATLSGFTLTGGYTRITASSSVDGSVAGGGAFCDQGGTLTNCTITGNNAFDGAGVFSGTIFNSSLSSNNATRFGGGMFGGKASSCQFRSNQGQFGGGVVVTTVRNSFFHKNKANDFGGGLYNAIAHHCLVTENTAQVGGGSIVGQLYFCTVVSNVASALAGGSYDDRIINSIVYFNEGGSASNYNLSTFQYSCFSPAVTSGTGNVFSDPLFESRAAKNYHLQRNSPAINAGLSDANVADTDLEGRPRNIGGRVDMGAYEFAFEGSIRLALAGAMTGTGVTMHTQLDTELSTLAPYAADARRASTIPGGTVDWILVGFRTNLNNAADLTRSYFLRHDGFVMDDTGQTNLIVLSTTPQYIIVHHRNHLAASSPSHALTNRLFHYDFTTGTNKYFGGGASATQSIPGVWTLIAGDSDGDGEILPADLLILHTQHGP